MSRSYHATLAQYLRERRFRYADEEKRDGRLGDVRTQIRKKRLAKKVARVDRAGRPLDDIPNITPEMIPIEIVDRGDQVHYPASPDDIRAVLGRLPSGVLSGLTGIRLCLGEKHQEEAAAKREDAVGDPWTGRLGQECLRRVWEGYVLGVYFPKHARINLYAYVYDGPLSAANTLYLRLCMLSTLVHEVAHHEDFVRRGARARVMSRGRSGKLEHYAITTEALWLRDCVVPYLEETYPDAIRDLSDWTRAHGGASLPLASLGGRWAWDSRGKVDIDIAGSACNAYEWLANDVADGGDPVTMRVAFAQELDFADLPAEALAAIDSVLADEPRNTQALVVQAEIFRFQKQYARAEEVARVVLDLDGSNLRAWRIIAEVCRAVNDWARLLAVTTSALAAASGAESTDRNVLRIHRACANAQLGNLAEAKAELDDVPPHDYLEWRVNKVRDILREKETPGQQRETP